MISIIAAMDEKRGIGKNNDLLFKVPEDFQRMKTLTTGHPIIMGRKTAQSIGRKLPNRTNIVITRENMLSQEIAADFMVNNLEEAVELAKNSPGGEEIFIFGGGQIFVQALLFADQLYLTIVKGDYGADTFFPEYEDQFPNVLKKETGKSGEYEYTFLDLKR